MVQMQFSYREDLKNLDMAWVRVQDFRPALRVIGQILRTSIVRNFEVGGRPQKWRKSGRAMMQGGQTLVDTARLRSSIARARPRVTDDSVAVGTRVKYAAAHHFGFWASVRTRRHKRVVRQAFGKPLKFPVWALVRAHWRRAQVEERPFMMIQDQDRLKIRAAILNYLTRGR